MSLIKLTIELHASLSQVATHGRHLKQRRRLCKCERAVLKRISSSDWTVNGMEHINSVLSINTSFTTATAFIYSTQNPAAREGVSPHHINSIMCHVIKVSLESFLQLLRLITLHWSFFSLFMFYICMFNYKATDEAKRNLIKQRERLSVKPARPLNMARKFCRTMTKHRR